MHARTLPLALVLLAGCGHEAAPTASAPPTSASAATAPPGASKPVDKAAFEAAPARAVKLQDSGGDSQEVLAALTVAHNLDPKHPGINRRLGQVYTDLRLNDQALESYKAVLAAQPEDHEVLMNVVT